MITYTVTTFSSGEILARGVSLDHAAKEALTYDGFFYEIRPADGGGFDLWTSDHSRNWAGGAKIGQSIIYGATETEIWQKVVDNAEWWKVDVMTDAAYDEMLADAK